MKVECYSVRLASMERISPKAYKAVAFDGSSEIIPASQIFGNDKDVQKSEAYWISAWILKRKKIQYSNKKTAYFDKETGKMLPHVIIERHTPTPINPVENNEIDDLRTE